MLATVPTSWRLFAVASCATVFLATPSRSQQPQSDSSRGSASAGSPNAIQPKIPIASFVAPPFVDDPILSPNGERIVSRLARRKNAVLSLVRALEKPALPNAAREVSFEAFPLHWYRWLTNDALLVSAGSTLYVHDAAAESTRSLPTLIDGAPIGRILHVDPQGRFILAEVDFESPSFPAVYRIDVSSGKTTQVVAGQKPVLLWYADSEGVVRLGIGYEGRKIKIVTRERDGEQFKTVAKFSWEDSDGDVDAIHFPGRDGLSYVVSNAKSGRFGLYEFDSKSFEIGAPVFEHPTVDVDRVLVNDQGEVDGVAYTDDRARVHWLNPVMRELQAEIDTRLKGRINRLESRAVGDRRVIVWSATASDPGRYYFYDRERGEMTLIAIPIDALKDKKLAPVQAVTYRSRDGLEIPAYLTLPLDTAPSKLPLIVMPHGGPHVRDTWIYDAEVQFLASRGYAVLQPNFRGSSGYGKQFMELGFGEWGRAMQTDLDDGTRWLIDQGIVDARRICIMGISYGGYAALMGVIQSPELYRCAISFAGVSDVERIMNAPQYFMPPERYRALRKRFVGKRGVNLRKVSPQRLADKVGAPVFLAHNSVDPNVPFSHSRRMAEALTKSGKEHEFLELRGIGHGFDTPENHLRFLSAVEVFLTKHNPAGPIDPPSGD